jgi:hypothetical protein
MCGFKGPLVPGSVRVRIHESSQLPYYIGNIPWFKFKQTRTVRGLQSRSPAAAVACILSTVSLALDVRVLLTPWCCPSPAGST